MGNSFGVEKGKSAAPPPAGDKEEDHLQEKPCRSRFEPHNTLALSAATDADSPTGITPERDEAANVLKRNARGQVMAMVTAAHQSGPHGNQADMVPAAVRHDLYCAQMGGVNCCLASLLSPRSGPLDDEEVDDADADTSVGVLKEE